MKLRIQGNSVRFRLTRREVESLGQGVVVEQVTAFSPTASLKSLVRPMPLLERLQAEFADGILVVDIPLDQTRQWAWSEIVGMEDIADNGSSSGLRILIEKDFQCLHKDDEQTVDAYPNPRLAR